ncbi:protein MIS12 homolog [Brienomyrus brachyistius]|uniref:protein MIS12 homolog n=1 Tax=Brienomyrus brachyistius TaxID=42636 RepID=UPI0020B32DE4|nr:protein MIS12 homolog [Brienomyrus brachyistius]
MAECGIEAMPLSPETLKLYEAQFFGFTPQTCMLRVYSAFQDCLHDILMTVEAVFVRKLAGEKPPEKLSQQARECTSKLHAFLQERIQRLSSRMDALLVDSVLSIPPNVLLPEDGPHKEQPRDMKELLELEGELAQLQQCYQAEVCARQALLAELEEQREVQEDLDNLLRWIGELRASWMQGGLGDVQESLTFMTRTVKHVRDVMQGITQKSSMLDHH